MMNSNAMLYYLNLSYTISGRLITVIGVVLFLRSLGHPIPNKTVGCWRPPILRARHRLRPGLHPAVGGFESQLIWLRSHNNLPQVNRKPCYFLNQIIRRLPATSSPPQLYRTTKVGNPSMAPSGIVSITAHPHFDKGPHIHATDTASPSS